MKHSKLDLWKRFQNSYREFPSVQLATDFSRVDFADDFLTRMEPAMQKAFASMEQLEKGAIANPDEKRMVGHYWLRNSDLAPDPAIKQEIEATLIRIKHFAKEVHEGKIVGTGGRFKNVLVIGIGGSALGPQFVANALGHPSTDKMALYFFDNTDPDGMDRVIASLDCSLGQTLSIVISKSGGTKETRNGMLEARAAYETAGLDFSKHAVAITMTGSELDKVSANWIAQFPMWDWVGGRTSQLSAVGLLPAALQGLDIDLLIAGAKSCDIQTRSKVTAENPAAMLSLAWFQSGNGLGEKCMVVLPYKDRLELFSKYLQQLVMESLGKELDLDGQKVNQGLTVFGNKGSTDQHSYIQQLRDGLDNFFAVFIEVLKDRAGQSMTVEPSTTTGDFLQGFFLGTREALFESGRQSVTLTVPEVNGFTVGMLIALFERAVGLYAALININAYHQPGVQAGKVAADIVIKLKVSVINFLNTNKGTSFTAEQIAAGVDAKEQAETVFKICEHLCANPDRGIVKIAGATPVSARYRKV